MNSSQTNRRSELRALVKPGLQLRLICVFLGICAFSVLFQILLLDSSFDRALERARESGEPVDTAGTVFHGVLITLSVMGPILLALGLLVTHRIAGPVYRFELHLDAIIRGENPGPCRIRRGDELQDLCGKINGAVEILREQEPKKEGRSAA